MSISDLDRELPTRRLRPPPQAGSAPPTQLPFHVSTMVAPNSSFSRGDSVAPLGYEILGILGRGGMGVVWKARQIGLNRIVALKMIQAGMDAGGEASERFHREAAAVARLRHPNILQIFEVGACEGRPYFSLEFVDGGTLHQHIDRKPCDVRFAAEIVETLARAIQHAHDQNIIHRDLKPSNILLHIKDGTVDPNQLKVADFGLARHLNEENRLTATGFTAGTPPYMAPELFAIGQADQAGGSIDLYAMGIILYEMLTGRPPFTGSQAEIIHQVLLHDPIPPRRLQPAIPRDLETICLKCLRKDPRHRYTRAADLANDLARFLEGRPITARSIGPVVQARLWGRRNPLAASLMAAVGAVLLIGAGVATYFAVRAERNAGYFREQERIANLEKTKALEANREKDDALRRETIEREAAQRLAELKNAEAYDSDMVIAHRDWEKGQIARAQQILDRYRTIEPGRRDPRGFEWGYLDRLTRSELFNLPDASSGPIAASPDGTRIATALGSHILIRSVTSGEIEHRITSHRTYVSSVDFNKTGKLLVSASDDKTVMIHNVESGETTFEFKKHSEQVFNARFAPDGETIVSAAMNPRDNQAGGEIFVWKTGSDRILNRLEGHHGTLMNFDFTPDGKTLLGCVSGTAVYRWDLPTGKALPPFRFQNAAAVRIAVEPPTGRTTALSMSNGVVLIVDTRSGQELRSFKGSSEVMNALAFSPDGDYLAAGGNDSLIHYYQVAAGHEARTFRGSGASFINVAFAPGKQLKLTATSTTGDVKIWDAHVDPDRRQVELPAGGAWRLAISPDRRLAAVALLSGHVVLIDTATWKTVRMINRRYTENNLPRDVHFSPDGKLVAMVTGGGTVEFNAVDAETDCPLDLKSPEGSAISSAAFSHDGKSVATGHHDGVIRIHDLNRIKPVDVLKGHEDTVQSLAFDPTDANRLVSGSDDSSVRFWNIDKGEAVSVRKVHEHHVNSVRYSSNGKWVVTSGASSRVIVWDAATARPKHTLEGNLNLVPRTIFSPSNDRVATCSLDGSIRLFDVETGKETLMLRDSRLGGFHDLAFTADGLRLFATSRDRNIRLWDAR